jgi:preprotein translocase subunit SecD
MAHATRVGSRLLAAVVAAAVVAGCSISTTDVDPLASPTPSTTVPAGPSASAPPELDLQLRPVVSADRPAPEQCAELPARTPEARAPATLCSNDGRVSYDLEPAAVKGGSVTSIEVLESATGPVIQVKLDAQGATALRTTTLRGSLQDPQPMLAIVTHGGVLAAPTMTEELDGGVLLVSGWDSREQAQEVVDYIRAAGP